LYVQISLRRNCGSEIGDGGDKVVTKIRVQNKRDRAQGDFVRIAIFGAAGATGRALVMQALTQGHQVTAFVRTPSKFDLTHANLNVVQGDVADAAAVELALFGQDAVLCTLGASTPLKRDQTLVNGMDNIVRAMERSGPRRLIYLSFLGVSGGREQLSLLGRYVVAPLILRNVVTDHEAKEIIITRSCLDWTIVRSPRLTNGPHTGAYRHGGNIKATSMIPMISRADVADFMLLQLDDLAYLRKAPAVMY
jgi:putative NADH-flavin reductase